MSFSLENISFCLPSKGLVLLYGASGSGKSSILNLLAGLDKADKGCIKIFAKAYKKNNRKHNLKIRNEYIGMIFQHYHLFEDESVKDNLQIASSFKLKEKDANEKIDDLLKQFNLSHLEEAICKDLSGGEKQRISFLRAIINEPSILLADEPTGALDDENGKIIVSYLKKYSIDHLVIVVSHNLGLFKDVSDVIMHLKDGKIEFERNIEFIENLNDKKIVVKKDDKWTKKFIKKYNKKYRHQNIVSLCSASLGIFFSIIATGISYSAEKSLLDLSATSFNSDVFYISKKEYLNIDNSNVQISKSYRPHFEELEVVGNNLRNVTFDYDLSALFPNYVEVKCDNVPHSTNLGITRTLLKEENKFIFKSDYIEDSLDGCVVNEPFLNMIGINIDEAIDTRINIDLENYVTIYTENETNPKIEDYFIFQKTLKIFGVSKEFPLLNEPRIYLSYEAIKKYAKETIAINYSQSINEEKSFYEIIANAHSDDPIGNYQMVGFLSDDELDILNKYRKKLDENNKSTFSITSISLLTYDVFISFVDIALFALFGFIILAILSSISIIAMTSFATFLNEKKNAAILSILGADDEDIEKIFVRPKIYLSIIASSLSFFLALGVTYIFNCIFFNVFGVNNLLTIPLLSYLDIPFFLPIIIYLLSIILCYLSTKIPLLYHRKNALYLELASE